MNTILEIEPSHQSLLGAAGLVEFDAFMLVAGGKPVSWHRHRETVPLDLSINGRSGRFYLKRVFRVPPKHAFWPLFRLRKGESQPRHEWRILDQLQRAGIPAMRRVAFGERRRLGMPVSAFLLVEAVPVPHTLENWLVPGFPKPAAVDQSLLGRLLHDVGTLLGRLHHAGFLWPDAHAKHIFASPPPGGGAARAWQLCIIDVERMGQLPSAPAPEQAAREITILRNSLRPMPLSEEDLRRFLTGYLEGSPASPFGVQVVSGVGHAKLARLADAASCPRLPDEYRHPRCCGVVRSNDLFVDPAVMPLLAQRGLRCFQDVFSGVGGESLRKAALHEYRDRIRFKTEDDGGGARTFYLKRYHRPPPSEQFRRIHEAGALRSTAWRETRFAMRLTRLGIPTIRLVAFGEKMWGPWERASFAISEEIPGESLESLAVRVLSGQAPAPSWHDRVEIIRQLAMIAALLHRNRLFHRDLYLSHVFWSRNRCGEIILWLIDLARMLERPACRRRWQIKDLAALHYSAPVGFVTRADRLRFLYYYQIASQRSGDPDRELIAAVVRRARRMAVHDVNKARRNSRRQ